MGDATVRNINEPFMQLSRLAIAQVTSGRKKLNKEAYTTTQLHNIQRFANKLQRNKDKDFIIVY